MILTLRKVDFFLFIFFINFALYGQVSAEIVGDNYYGRKTAITFLDTFNLPSERYGLSFNENTQAALYPPKNKNDKAIFDCMRGADGKLHVTGKRQIGVSVRLCDKSIIKEQLKKVYKVSKKQVIHTTKHFQKESFEHYSFPMTIFGHGLFVSTYYVTISKNRETAIITSIYFYNGKNNCPPQINTICTDDGTLINKFNMTILKQENNYLVSSVNEMFSPLAYSITTEQWKKMERINSLLKKSGALEKITAKYPELHAKDMLDPIRNGGILHDQKDGTKRAYISIGINIPYEQYSKEAISDIYQILLQEFDVFMQKYLLSIAENE